MELMKTKVTFEYWGRFKSATSEDYRIIKIVGSPTVRVYDHKEQAYFSKRVGDMLSEKEVEELSSQLQVTIIPKDK